MATCKLNAEQFTQFISDFSGVMLVYKSTNREGVTTESAQHFFGAEYEAKSNSQDELFRVWKNVVATFWGVKLKETQLREDNDGIRSKLRASTPARIIFHTENKLPLKTYELESSVWAKIGLVPTKKDLERSARDYKKAIHAATKASFDALGFRVDFAKDEIVGEVKNDPPTEPTKEQIPSTDNSSETVVETPPTATPPAKRGRPAKGAEGVHKAA